MLRAAAQQAGRFFQDHQRRNEREPDGEARAHQGLAPRLTAPGLPGGPVISVTKPASAARHASIAGLARGKPAN
jgi:hypothetical protein